MRQRIPTALVVAISLAGHPMLIAQSVGQRAPVFKSSTELVLVNVVVRGPNGAPVRGLRRGDFTVLEDGTPQAIQTFDAEDLGVAAEAPPAPERLLGTALGAERRAPAPGPALKSAPAVPTGNLRGRRLVVLFFDLSSMQPEDVRRAVTAARTYVSTLTPNDLVAVTSFGTSLRLDHDFTADRDALDAALARFGGADAQGFEAGSTGDAEDTPDTGAAFTADDTEFNIFETDRRLQALQSLSDALAGIEQKKSIVYFSSGMSQSGQDNQVQLRRTVNRAVRANVSIYASDARGLQAMVPGGEAREASLRGQAPFSGASVSTQYDQLATSQDTLATLAEDTGGRAFFDSNDLSGVFSQVVADTSMYYVLGYTSTNGARDGHFRRITVRINRPGVKLEYRSGYYAGRDFAHSSRADREAQLEDQLLSDLSATDLAAYLSTAAFRLAPARAFVSISVIVPGYQIPVGAAGRSRPSLDVLGVVQDGGKRPVGRIRDTVELAPETLADLPRKVVQYETGLELAPGTYRIKVVVRENIQGTFGSYEATITVPDWKTGPVKLSSVVLGTQLRPDARRDDPSPLAEHGQKLVPNVTRVVSAAQHLYFHYEVYDPAVAPAGGSDSITLMTSLTFFRGRARAFETPPVEVHAITDADRHAAVFRFDLPPGSLPPGLYTCQVNVVDDVAGSFVFPRMQIYVRR